MTKTVVSLIAVTLAVGPISASAQVVCPPEVQAAKDALKARQTGQTGPPRSLAGAQTTDAPRGQDVQAPRDENIQAPRGQDVQAPRGQDVQAPRAPAGAREQDARGAASPSSAATLDRAQRLVSDAEAACARNDMGKASASAKEALGIIESD